MMISGVGDLRFSILAFRASEIGMGNGITSISSVPLFLAEYMVVWIGSVVAGSVRRLQIIRRPRPTHRDFDTIVFHRCPQPRLNGEWGIRGIRRLTF